MSVTGSVRSGLRTAGLIVETLIWCMVTLWLGFAALWKGLWFVTHVRQTFSRTLRCPRGHAVDAFGPLRCGRCHAAFEGHIFDPCPVCGAKARHIACPRCGLAIRNQLS